MSKRSERQRLLSEIVDMIAVADLDEEDDDILSNMNGNLDENEIIFSQTDDTSDLLQLVQSSRYLVDRERAANCTMFIGDVFRFTIPDNRFREMTRIDRDTFERVVCEIENNLIFHNSSYCPQAPVWLQLAVALGRFANNGTGASLNRSERLWGIGHGTVGDYTKRVVTALNALTSKYVRWPSAVERRKVSKWMSAIGFRGCIGFIDCTTIPLAQKPAKDGQCFFYRKQRYSLNGQVVCDPWRRIIGFFSGWPGSCSDSTTYQEMALSKNEFKRHFLSNGEYLLADSAYPADLSHNTVVPAYKSNVRGTDIEDFNTCVAHARVVNEHTIGVLKNGWASLKELPTQLNEEETMESILNWITACITLHNLMMELNDEWSDSEVSSSEGEDDMLFDGFDSGDNDPFTFRRNVKQRAIVISREPGGILWFRFQQDIP